MIVAATSATRSADVIPCGAMLSGLRSNDAVVAVAIPASAWALTSYYATPIFGITDDDGTLLVADAGQGIVDGDTGALVTALPGVTDVAARAGGGLWATTSAERGRPVCRASIS